jgi:hypothetical protein
LRFQNRYQVLFGISNREVKSFKHTSHKPDLRAGFLF